MAVAATTKNLAFQNIQRNIIDIAGKSSPSELFPSVGVLPALVSADNTQGLPGLQLEFDGKDRPQSASGKPEFKVKYLKASCDYTTSGSLDICATLDADPEPYGYVDATIAKQYFRQFSITNAQFANLDETPDERITLRIMQHMKDILVDINNDMASKLYAQVGDYFDGTDSATSPRELPLIGTTGNYQPIALSGISKEYRTNGYNGRPILVGGPMLDMAAQAGNLQGVGNFTTPFATPQLPVAMYTDYLLDSTLGTTNAGITWLPGTVRLMEYLDNKGYNEIDRPNKKATVMSYMGYLFDVTIIISDCTEKHIVSIAKWADLFYPTDAMYADCWKKGIDAWKFVCGDADCNFFTNV